MSGLVAAGIYTAGFANADTHIWVGGAGDPNADGVVATAQAQGRYNPNDNNIQINYPAEIGPVVGSTPEGVSVDQGAQAVVDAYNANAGDHVTVEGFSLGALVVDQASQALRAQNGGNVPGNLTPITEGNADAQSGLFHNPLAPIVAPFAQAFADVNMGNTPVPGTINRFDVRDFWGNGNQPDLVGNIEQLADLGTAHRVPDPNEPHETYTGPDGVQNEVYGNTDVPVVGAMDPAQNPFLNPQGVVDNVENAVAPVVNAPDAVRLSNPEFFGEQACVAPDGSQYYTPGDAPC